MNLTAASEATPSFGWNPSGSFRQPGPGFKSEHLWRRDSPSTKRNPPFRAGRGSGGGQEGFRRGSERGFIDQV
eukprot:102462-Prorocentrum_minimum.AAC.1